VPHNFNLDRSLFLPSRLNQAPVKNFAMVNRVPSRLTLESNSEDSNEELELADTEKTVEQGSNEGSFMSVIS